jgi:hypothetical protein
VIGDSATAVVVANLERKRLSRDGIASAGPLPGP